MMTIVVLVIDETVAVGPPPLICTPYDPVLSKNPDGYVSVTLLPIASAPPAVVLNEKVAAANRLPTTRSDVAIIKDSPVTWPPIAPELILFDVEILVHNLACNRTPVEPAVAAPNVKPPMVMVNADALMAAPDIVNMTEDEVVELQVADKRATLLEPTAAEGVTEEARKL